MALPSRTHLRPLMLRREDRRPPEEEWEAKRELIHDMYIGQSMTIEQVIDALKLVWTYNVTPRMLKGRLEKWGGANKNMKGLEYEAMKLSYEQILAAEEVEVVFQSQCGPKVKTYRIADVRKQLARPGTLKRREANLRTIAEGSINEIFQRKDIQIIRPNSNIRPQCVMESESPRSPDSQSTPSNSGSEQGRSPGSEEAVVIANPVATHSFSSPIPRNPRRSEHEAAFSLGLNFESWLPNRHSDRSEDIWYDTRLDPFSQQSDARRDPESWATYLFQTCIKTDERRIGAGEDRNSARHAFARMLQTRNPHILSGLIYVTCVLLGLGAYQFNQSILEDCCELIDRDGGSNWIYAIPFRYALACENKDDDAISRFGTQLLHANGQADYESQRSGSNFLIFQQFLAHHLLEHMDDATGAREILTRCLQNSSFCFQSDNAVNMNSLKLLARAHERLGEIQVAVRILDQAAERCVRVFGFRHPYRMILLNNTALLQERLGQLGEAEAKLADVFLSQTDILGPGHGCTYSSVEDLGDFHKRHGRQGDARLLMEWHRASYRDDKHWKLVADDEAISIRRQRRNAGLYWEREGGLFKYEFLIPEEAYVRPRDP